MFSQNTKVQKNKDSQLAMDVSLSSSISVILSSYEDIICLQVFLLLFFFLCEIFILERQKRDPCQLLWQMVVTGALYYVSPWTDFMLFLMLCSSWSFDIWMCLSLKEPHPEILKNSFSLEASDIVYILLTDAINKAFSQLQSLKVAE